MRGKCSKIFFTTALIVTNTFAYVFGPIEDQIMLYGIGYILSLTCETDLPFDSIYNVPSTPITADNVSFLLYTRENPKQAQILHLNDSIELLSSSNLNFTRKTVLYVHGYNESYIAGAMNFTTRLLPYQDINLIITDWDSYVYFNQPFSAFNTYPRLGKIVANFIRKFIQIGANPKNIHLVGYSAGGEVVAFAGKLLNPKVGRITAFSPQGYCFDTLPPSKRISDTDADFVEIAHCDVLLGAEFSAVRGNVTFVVNGGILQPQCTNQTDWHSLSRCGHLACEDYLYNSLSRNAHLVGVKCDSYLDYLLNKCNQSDRMILRYDVPISAQGIYYVETLPFQEREPRDY